MATGESKIMKKLRDITECSICLNTYTDPRMLKCIHTFCLKCLTEVALKSGKKSGDTFSCPICRKEFTIPEKGLENTQKNFFMGNLIEMTKNTQIFQEDNLCEVCMSMNTGEPEKKSSATMYCVDCQENMCNDCDRRHRAMKGSRDHRIVEIRSKKHEEDLSRSFVRQFTCEQHVGKLQDLYCNDCRTIACTTCVNTSHKSHNWSEVTDVAEVLRQIISKDLNKISAMISTNPMMEQLKRKREDFLKEISDTDKAILTRSEELKEIIERQTKSLLDELNLIKQKRLKEMEIEKDEMETHLSFLESFKFYCTELTSKGSSGDICYSFGQIQARTKDLKETDASLYDRSLSSVHVAFSVTTADNFPQKHTIQYCSATDFFKKYNDHMVGRIEESVTESSNCLVIVGLYNGLTMGNDVLKINLQPPNEVTKLNSFPTAVALVAAAAVNNNILYVSGIGKHKKEIWKYDLISKWSQCGTLVQGRRRHCATFIEEILYISCGFVDSDQSALNGVEAFEISTDKCTAVGQLIHGVYFAASAAFRGSLYIFGGCIPTNDSVNYVQVYDTHENQCTLLQKPVPRPSRDLRAFVLEKSIVLLGQSTSFIFNPESEAWQERRALRTDASHFGLVIQNDKAYVIGGGITEIDKDGKSTWRCRDDVRSLPILNIVENRPTTWKVQSKLANPSLIFAYGVLKFPI